jgi:hypothetical protein
MILPDETRARHGDVPRQTHTLLLRDVLGRGHRFFLFVRLPRAARGGSGLAAGLLALSDPLADAHGLAGRHHYPGAIRHGHAYAQRHAHADGYGHACAYGGATHADRSAGHAHAGAR